MKPIKLLVFFFLAPLVSIAQEIEVSGVVRDSVTRETLPYVTIYLKNTTKGTATDIYGKFTLVVKEKGTLVFSMMGYKDFKLNVTPNGGKKYVKVNMTPEFEQLDEVVIKPKRQKYKNKNNPAVDLVREMIEKRDVASPRNHDYYNVDYYQKIMYAWNEFEEHKHNGLSRKFGFLYDHTDTSRYGKSILPVGLRECSSTIYFRKGPETKRIRINAMKNVGIDEVFPQDGVRKTLDEMFQEVDIFENDVTLLSNHFVSPLSSVAPSFYKYFIVDTLVVDGDTCVNLAFTPRTTEAYGFTGSLYVSTDSSRFIHHAHFNIPRDINLNFVETMYFEQDFSRSQDGTRQIDRDYVCVEFYVPTLPRVYGERLNSYKNYSFDKTSDTTIFEEKALVLEAPDANERSNAAWDSLRHTPLNGEEKRTDSLMMQLNEVRLFKAFRKGMDVC